MRLPRFRLAELMLAVAFVGLLTVVVVRTWDSIFFLHGLAMAVPVLFLSFLLLVIMMRQYRGS